MRYPKIKQKFFKQNREKLMNSIPDNSLVILFSADVKHRNGDQNFKYRQNSDFFYYTGIEQEESILLITKIDKDIKEKLYITLATKKSKIWVGKKLDVLKAKSISSLVFVNYLNSLEKDLLNLSHLKLNIYSNYIDKNIFNKKLKPYVNTNIFNNSKINDISPISIQQRLIKQPYELELIKKAINITEKAFYRALSKIKPNIYEYEIEAELTYEFFKNGASSHSFEPIVSSGKNACVLHYTENDKICNDNDLVLLDFGVEYANYASDCSRTIPINGKYTKRQKQIYYAVSRVLKKATNLYIPGTTINKINSQVNKLMIQELININLIKPESKNKKNKLKKYYMHGVAHFVGLDVHDVGDKDIELKKGMVLTCEPGIYIEKEGIGIRIENMILVGEKPKNLSNKIPISALSIEKLMKNNNFIKKQRWKK